MKKIAFLFAGQGAQYVGMGKDLCESFPESKAIFDKADKVLGFDIKRRCFEGPPEMLKMTNISQAAIVTVGIAAFEAFQSNSNLKPDFCAGLSLGEYTALIAAGSLSFENGLRLVKKRAELMDDASRKYPGKMVAVLDLALDKIKEICLKSQAQIANINAPNQIVITGKIGAVEQAKELCLKEGAKKVVDLEVSGGFHSSLMFEASVDLKLFLENTPITQPVIPVVSNYTASPQYKVTQILENLVLQMRSPVKWEDSMRFMLSEGVTKFIEFGPGRVLKGLMRRIEPDAEVINIEKKEDILNFKVA